jgi:hypothetical protein
MRKQPNADTARSVSEVARRLLVMQPGRCVDLVSAVGDMIERLSRDEVALSRIATRSHVHENGFLKIALTDVSDDQPFTVRLHLWRAQQAPGNVHNHRWPFTSLVLGGALAHEEFSLEGNGDTFHRTQYRGNTCEEYQLMASSATTLKQVTGGTRERGTIYRMNPWQLHRSWSIAETTATLVVRGADQRDYADVFTSQPIADSQTFMPRPLSPRVTRQAMTAAVAACRTSDLI